METKATEILRKEYSPEDLKVLSKIANNTAINIRHRIDAMDEFLKAKNKDPLNNSVVLALALEDFEKVRGTIRTVTNENLVSAMGASFMTGIEYVLDILDQNDIPENKIQSTFKTADGKLKPDYRNEAMKLHLKHWDQLENFFEI